MMCKRFASLFAQDAKVTIRNGYFHVVILLAVIYSALLLFVIPKEMKIGTTEYVFDETGTVFTEMLMDVERSHIMSTERELRERLEREPASIGIILGGTKEKPALRIVHQGSENPKNLRLLELSFNQALREYRNESNVSNHIVTKLRNTIEKPPFNKALLPVFAATEVIMFGFMIIAVMVFQEKKEGTLRAYRVTPGSAYEYIASKTLINILMAVAFGLILTVAVMGVNVSFIPLLAIFILGSTLITLLGLWVSTYFRDLESFIFVALGVMMIFGLPMASYFFPAFYLRFFDLIPSYTLMFGIREILFPTGKSGFLLPMLFTLACEILIVGFFTARAVSKRLLKGGF